MTVGTELETLNARFPCRASDIRSLAVLFAPSSPTPPTLVIHGLESTGKSSITKAVLETVRVPHAIVDSRECITARHLLEQASALSRHVAQEHSASSAATGNVPKCESVNSLQNHLEKFLRGISKFVLVFDGIDQQRESSPILMPGLARIGSTIPGLCVVFIVSLPSPRLLYLPGTPHVHFSSYSREETLKIVSRDTQPIFLDLNAVDDPDYGPEEAAEDDAWLWSRYIAVVWDSVGKGAARELKSFTAVCHKLWRPFVQPILDGTFGTRDFSKLLVSRRSIFQNEDFLKGNTLKQRSTSAVQNRTAMQELPYFTKFILCAAYLASYNPARQDKIFFMKSSERKKRKRAAGAAGKVGKHQKIPRHLLNPSPFALDRLLAILHAIVPHSLAQTGSIATQIATLTSLRLLLRTGTAGADILDPALRFRVQCSWDYVSSLGRSVGFEMRDYLAT